MSEENQKAKINLALLAIQRDPKLSFRRVVQIYKVSHEQLSRRTRESSLDVTNQLIHGN